MSRDDEGFLARWSRRKVQARKSPPEEAAPAPAPATTAGSAAASASGIAPPAPAPAELPALESLTPHSDFSAFMRPDVDPSLKGEALKTLFSDPALYPMDGLDVYIDDYTKPDPLPEGWLERLNQLATLHGEPAPERPQNEDERPVSAQIPAAEPVAVAREQIGSQEASNAFDASEPAPDSNDRGTA